METSVIDEDLGYRLKVVALHNSVLGMPKSFLEGTPSLGTMYIQVSSVLSKLYPLGLQGIKCWFLSSSTHRLLARNTGILMASTSYIMVIQNLH